MSEGKAVSWRAAPFWALLTFVAFAAVVLLASSGAINAVTTTILMIVPAGLFFQSIRVAGRTGPCGGRGEAKRRYLKRMMVFSSAYLLAIAGHVTFRDAQFPMAAQIAIALLPGLAVIGVFWAIGRLIVEEQDEFLRMLTVRQTLIATALALSFATLWGFLENAGIVAHIDGYWYAVAFFFGLLVGAVANRIEYGAWGAA